MHAYKGIGSAAHLIPMVICRPTTMLVNDRRWVAALTMAWVAALPADHRVIELAICTCRHLLIAATVRPGRYCVARPLI